MLFFGFIKPAIFYNGRWYRQSMYNDRRWIDLYTFNAGFVVIPLIPNPCQIDI
jgi:hypothetical protein